jgi:hypothetical protein
VRPVLVRTVLFGIPLYTLLCVIGWVIPPVVGRVGDAKTGKGVPGIDVTLEYCQWKMGASVCADVAGRTRTGRFGWFFFPGAIAWTWNPLELFQSSWLAVNEGNRGLLANSGGSSASLIVYRTINDPARSVANPNYFPITIMSHRRGCTTTWEAACREQSFVWGFSIALMPVLQHVEDCANLRQPRLREGCRELNTYLAAFAHVDTNQEVQKGKELCGEVDHGELSKICLEQLDTYVANSSAGGVVQPKPESIPDVMFPDSIAGVPVMKNKHCGPRLKFSGRLMCAAGYGSDTPIIRELVAIYIEDWPGSAKSILPESWRPQYTDHAEASVSTDVWQGGGKLLHYKGPMYESFFWYGGENHVEVFFYQPISERNDFVSYYMQRYPSTLP